MVSCAACGCSRTTTTKNLGITFHYFPKDPHRRKLWSDFMKKAEWIPKNRSALCSQHFAANCFDRTSQLIVRLQETANPTIEVNRLKYVRTFNPMLKSAVRGITETGSPNESPKIHETDVRESTVFGPSTSAHTFSSISTGTKELTQDSPRTIRLKRKIDELCWKSILKNSKIRRLQKTALHQNEKVLYSKALHENNHQKQLMSDNFKQEMNLLPDTVYIKADIDTDECVSTTHPIIKQEFHVLNDECIDIKEDLPSNNESEPNTEDKPKDTSKPFPCTECNFRCKTKSNLKIHMRLHTGEKPFSCTYCNYKCTLKYHLHRHIRMHTGEKPFVCNECSYKTTDKGKLREHNKRHTGDKRYSCTFCDYKCVSNCDMKRHIRKHTGEKLFACSDCSYRAVRKSNLIEHMKRHTGQKPFNCTYCDYRFVNKYDLSRHVRTHTGEKPFACSKCLYRGTTQAKLKQHVATHDIESPFLCDACSFKTTRKSTLTNHKKKCKRVDVLLPVEYVSIETSSEDVGRFFDESKQSEVLHETSEDVFKSLKQEIDVKEEPL